MVMKGRPLAKQGYEQELSSIRAFVAMQNKADTGGSPTGDHVSTPQVILKSPLPLQRMILFCEFFFAV